MQTSKWGPPLWKVLHTIAHNYDPETHDVEDYKKFFKLLGKVLPCKYCRESYVVFFDEIPIDKYTKCQKDMAYWVYLMHNKVNDKLRKQGLLHAEDPPFSAVYAKYDKWRADCTKKKNKPATCRIPDHDKRCGEMTQKGKRCTRPIQHGSKKCIQHINCAKNNTCTELNNSNKRKTSRSTKISGSKNMKTCKIERKNKN